MSRVLRNVLLENIGFKVVALIVALVILVFFVIGYGLGRVLL